MTAVDSTRGLIHGEQVQAMTSSFLYETPGGWTGYPGDHPLQPVRGTPGTGDGDRQS